MGSQPPKPSWGSFSTGVNRALGWLPSWQKDQGGELFFGQHPSRATLRDLVTGRNANPEPKDVENKMVTIAAKAAAERVAAGDKMTKEYETEAPTDPPEEKVGTGPLATSHTPRSERAALEEQGGYGIIRMPDGRIVVSNDPGAASAAGGVVDPPGARSNVVSGPAGTVFSSSEKALIGPGGADMAGVNLPTDEDRSPGWATRKAYSDLYSQGNLSMNPRDIMDRRRWEESEEARESDIELARARRDYTIMQSQIDPYRIAQIEAEGKYAGKAIEQEAQNARLMRAMSFYASLGQQISALEQQLGQVPAGSAQAAALQQALDRAMQERRELANIALGFRVNDPDLNPFAAMFGASMGAPPAATGGGE